MSFTTVLSFSANSPVSRDRSSDLARERRMEAAFCVMPRTIPSSCGESPSHTLSVNASRSVGGRLSIATQSAISATTSSSAEGELEGGLRVAESLSLRDCLDRVHQAVAGDSNEPGGLGIRGNVLESPPRNREDLGDEVLSLERVASTVPVEQVPIDCVGVGLDKPRE
jgi:hypothetical protein